MVKIVNQRTNGDCGVCCLAMMTGESYESIVKSFFDDKVPYGVGFDKMLESLSELRFKAAWIIGWHHEVEGILSVPSLNYPGKLHFIYYDGKDVYDPNNGLPDRKFYTKELLLESTVDSSIINVNNDQARAIVAWCRDFFNQQAKDLRIE